MFRKIFILISLSLILSACSGGAMNGLGVLDPDSGSEGLESTEQATKIGSPGEELPEPPQKALVEKILSGSPNWQGSYAEDADGSGKAVLIEFDITSMTASIFSPDDGKIYSTGFEITDEGKVVSTASKTILNISATIREGSDIYPLNVMARNVGDERSARMFASTYKKDDYIDRFAYGSNMCRASASKSYDSDADVIGDASYFVAGFVVTHNDTGEECALTLFDSCEEEGKLLNEFVLDEDSPEGFVIRRVKCNCHNGQCMDEITDTALPFEEVHKAVQAARAASQFNSGLHELLTEEPNDMRTLSEEAKKDSIDMIFRLLR